MEEQLSEIELPASMQLSFNIAPTQLAYVIPNNEPHVLRQMAWGLVPSWSKDGVNKGKLINARSESILEKPSFRGPALRKHCLVPADSFYEWRTLPDKRKIPYRIRLKSGHLMFMAGLWEYWQSSIRSINTFTIITTTPNAEVSGLHDRMPVLLPDKEQQQKWLSISDPEEIKAMLAPPENDLLEIYRISEKLNTPGNDGPELHIPVEEENPPTLF